MYILKYQQISNSHRGEKMKTYTRIPGTIKENCPIPSICISQQLKLCFPHLLSSPSLNFQYAELDRDGNPIDLGGLLEECFCFSQDRSTQQMGIACDVQGMRRRAEGRQHTPWRLCLLHQVRWQNHQQGNDDKPFGAKQRLLQLLGPYQHGNKHLGLLMSAKFCH